MRSRRFIYGSMFFVALLGTTARGQAPRTFVASTGSDGNPCSRFAPCRTFQSALNAVAVGGEVVALDSAGFGSNLTINKSVAITASPGVFAGIVVFTGHGIDINAAGSDTVILRGLTINSQGGNDE